MRRWPSILLATVLTLTLAAPAAAIDPVPAEGHPYSVGDELHYHWGYPLDPSGSKWNPPDYAREAIESATLLHANTSTKARAPEFIKGGSGGERGEFWWAWQSVSPCTSNQLACAGHQVPANNSYYSEHASPKPTWRVTLSPQGDNCGATCRINWCENPDVDNSNCWYMKRVLIHELGHVLDLAHDPTHSEGTSVMYEDVPPYADPDGGDTKEYLSCDVARLQLLYSRDATDACPVDLPEGHPSYDRRHAGDRPHHRCGRHGRLLRSVGDLLGQAELRGLGLIRVVGERPHRRSDDRHPVPTVGQHRQLDRRPHAHHG